MGSPQPLLIRPNTSSFFHPTDRSGILRLAPSQQIELFCTNGFSSPRGIEKNTLSIGCAHENRFYLDGKSNRLNEFACRKFPYFTAQRRTTERCYNDSVLVDIGFKVDKHFLQVLTACHNPSTEQTYYSRYRLTPANVAAQQGSNRPKFVQGDFFPGKDVNALFKRDRQRDAIAAALNSDERASQFVQEGGDVFLSRGEVN